ncbi:MAG TPA: M1 family aminopeptidase [Candidatus Sulfopaludibacter sp.]|jgi:hypothetical protein|nr:M1 family aminopeptidase [Candidatus Sulfopaludibacter sp.]
MLLSAAAQAATLTGSVKDPSGAALSAVAVEVRSVPPVGGPKTLHTDSAGSFKLAGLAAGKYRVRVAHTSFDPFEEDVVLEEGKDATLEIKLKVAAVHETIEVAGAKRQNSDPVYRAMRDAGPGDSVQVENVVLHRDNGTITLKSGTLLFVPKAQGRDVAAAFSGDGEFTFDPATPIEKDHLKLLTEQETVRETFDRAYFCFSDRTGEEIRAQAKTPSTDARAADVLREFRKRLRNRVESPHSFSEYLVNSDSMDNLEADLLADLYNPSQPGFFNAYLHGRKHNDLRFFVRPRGVLPDLSPEEVAIINVDGEVDQEGVWYLAHLKTEIAAGKAASDQDNRVVRAESYKIETAIGKNDHLSATAELKLRAVSNGDRVIKVGLLPNLRVTRVSSAGAEVRFIQQDWREDGSFYLIMPEAMARDSVRDVLIEYQGDHVIRKAGGGNFSVGARESWYPSLNAFHDHSNYNLTFKVPKQYTLVSVGKLAKEWKEQDYACSQWISDAPIAVAGFNYGLFKKKEITDSQLQFNIEGYATSELPDYLRGAEEIGGMAPSRLMEQTMAEAQNAMRIYTAWFGKSEFSRIAITQQPAFSFGQSWPSLVYLPLSAFLDGTQRYRLMGGINSRLTDFVDEVTSHEVSHQWWGHMVGWSSYHDQWLSEGFAEFSAGLFLQLTEKSPDKYLKYWEHARQTLTEKNNYGRRANDAGPVWMGLRLDYYKNPNAYNSVVYRKGGYILHMLRYLMWDNKEADRPFIAMMKDFVATNMNGSATTEAFQRTVEKHMRPVMNLASDGKMDWFFNEWVYGSAIPKYKFDYTLTEEPDGKWMLHANLTQSEVPANFVMQVPVYLDIDGTPRRLGQIRITGSSSVTDLKVKLPSKPKKVWINAFHDVLEG